LRHLLDAIERYGKPKFLRTDNETVFTSRLFRFGLWLLGIKHQRTDKGCPWMNGRVERFFGTLKQKLSQ
ncbi:MAG: DDE-type integrase/transposase/recombinase, partial [Phycisphaerae bacterium]|nr:transposase family protein [Phycisphaerae bacterium]NIR48011.1 transposase family protein [candidate division KSB1 bacterium]NIS23544.1 transposase family protein [candidate division KSB1 bacterium]NIU24175.1 transposase family protein [candidate division KSB1 bacterium]NIV00267.1 DDE-type integrase/transposase/recombinase [Phycisphaerae bacterium]